MQTETGKLVRWIDDKGFGFIQPSTGGNDIFIHISALRGMSRSPVVGDTLHYQTEVDASGKPRAIQARFEGVPQQLTLEPAARKRASPSDSVPYDRRQRKPKQRIIRSQKRGGSLLLLFLFLSLILVGIYAYDTYGHRHAQTVARSMPPLVAESEIAEPHFQCQGKVYCSQMTSSEEAEFYLDNCPGTKMDGDRDGIPCENQF